MSLLKNNLCFFIFTAWGLLLSAVDTNNKQYVQEKPIIEPFFHRIASLLGRYDLMIKGMGAGLSIGFSIGSIAGQIIAMRRVGAEHPMNITILSSTYSTVLNARYHIVWEKATPFAYKVAKFLRLIT